MAVDLSTLAKPDREHMLETTREMMRELDRREAENLEAWRRVFQAEEDRRRG